VHSFGDIYKHEQVIAKVREPVRDVKVTYRVTIKAWEPTTNNVSPMQQLANGFS